MLFDCDGFWMSWLNPPNVPVTQLPIPPTDGIIRVDEEEASGSFTGLHLLSGRPIHGQCQMEPHHIFFIVVIDNITYIYNGDIVLEGGVFLVARGIRSKLFFQAGSLERLDDEEWIAVKTT